MGTTPELSLVYPELGDAADGPDGFSDMALAIEAKMSKLRAVDIPGQGFIAGPGYIAKGTTEVNLLDVTVPLLAIGWVEVDFCAQINGDVPPVGPTAWAGFLYLYINTVLIKVHRFHTQAAVNFLEPRVAGVAALPKAATSLRVVVNTTVDVNSTPTGAYFNYRDYEIRQYGALRV